MSNEVNVNEDELNQSYFKLVNTIGYLSKRKKISSSDVDRILESELELVSKFIFSEADLLDIDIKYLREMFLGIMKINSELCNLLQEVVE